MYVDGTVKNEQSRKLTLTWMKITYVRV